MTLLLGFAPIAAFILLARFSLSLALWIAFAAAFSLGIRAFVELGAPRAFDTAMTLLFGLLALYRGFVDPGMRLAWIGLIIELGLLLTVLWSLVNKAPFTRQYALAPILSEYGGEQFFIRTNYLLSAVWALSFAVMAAMDALTLFVHTLPAGTLAFVGLAAFLAALAFSWYASLETGRRIGKRVY